MNRLNTYPILVEAKSASSMCTITDRPEAGKLIAGYMINLRGTFVGVVPVNVRTTLGLITLNSSKSGNHITEENFGFITERTRARKGSTRFINTATAGAVLDLSFFHDYDISGNYSHGNVYPASTGEALSFTLPAIPATVSIDAVWEVHRLQSDKGESIYLPRHISSEFDLANKSKTLDGEVALIQMQATSGTTPSQITILNGNEEQKLFMSWNAFLAYTNAMFDFDQDEVTDAMFPMFSDDPMSIIKVQANTQMKLRASGGTGNAPVSVCSIEATPKGAKEISSRVSASSLKVDLDRINNSGSENAKSSAKIAFGLSQTTAPILPVTSRKI